ncbi:cell division protein FtsQ/DivIB [Virgibacillus pantothenticus]|uniref:cell division protein FtsQ/DivIB n=1 Tax=Virgibacillus pantothenticus TaxID=1473 RepID=UPI000984EB52|nr:FtsQ-type POTRA domain-containing protein [Virgibacillus pantothenticus]
MAQKKVVSIEDRIPKLKQARKKKANRRLLFYLSIFFILISIVVYLQSPLSYIRTIQVAGNSFLNDDEVVKQADLVKNENIWTIDTEVTESKLKDSPIIASAKVSRKLPWTVSITIDEYELVGYKQQETTYYPVLGNGTTLQSMGKNTYNGDAPLIKGFNKEAYLHRMTNELEKLPETIRKLISEVHWTPEKENNDKIMLYMNDGFVVDARIPNFAESMDIYPSIVSQLDEESEGIIHIGVGAYFESFKEGKKASSVAEEDREE